MKRVIIGVLISTFAVGLFTYTTEAQRRRRQRQHRTEQAPESHGIAEALGDLHWGMTNREVYNYFVRKIHDAYRERLSKVHDAMEEDRLRHQQDNEIQRIRRSYVRFNGQTTGWDVSFLRDEFTHGNHESMLVVRDGNSQNFYFFINDRLWKWYKAFDASVFEGQTFDQFAAALQGRFGHALEREGKLTERGQDKHWLEWQDPNTRLRAIDENRFYGFYCMVFEDKGTLARLDELRTNTIRHNQEGHALVDAVTQGEDAQLENQDVVDRLTGHIRRRTQAADDSSMTTAMTGNTTAPTTSTMTSSSMTNIDDDDPLRGLDF